MGPADIDVDSQCADLVSAVMSAWSNCGAGSITESSTALPDGLVAAISIGSASCVELLVSPDAKSSTWSALVSWPKVGGLERRALVPRHLLGAAHEKLRKAEFELQGWWHDGTEVVFGAFEVA